MGNQLPSTNSQTNNVELGTIQELFVHVWPILSETMSKEGDQIKLLNKQILQKLLDDDIINYGLGAMFGAFIGDALGSYLEFENHISEKQADKAMKMPGGGRAFPFLRPGMLTDDSQLASHLLKGLLDYDPKKTLQSQSKDLLVAIANQYNDWFTSPPFDIGHTTRSALRQINVLLKDMGIYDIDNRQLFFDQILKNVLDKIAEKNKSSQSNGSLMRITPMAFFVSLVMENSQNPAQKDFSHFHHLIRGQINMTHGSEAIFQTSGAYVDLLVRLIRRKSNSIEKVYQQFQEKYMAQSNEMPTQFINHVQSWIKESKLKPPSATSSIGWAKIAFTQSLIKLRKLIEKQQKKQQFMNPETYKAMIRSVLILGGDTDTNGAIAGGIIGSVLGFKNLPRQYLKKLFKVKMSQILKSKDWLSTRTQYEPHRVFLNALRLIQKFEPLRNKKSCNQAQTSQKIGLQKIKESDQNQMQEQSFIIPSDPNKTIAQEKIETISGKIVQDKQS